MPPFTRMAKLKIDFWRPVALTARLAGRRGALASAAAPSPARAPDDISVEEQVFTRTSQALRDAVGDVTGQVLLAQQPGVPELKNEMYTTQWTQHATFANAD
mmetsp:Transcript_31097/g.56572  ORF Transcript_31097/g.56572 Transcript_31097/m.56572 type:complete len:102 (+) Transcript_31097:1195-1500(+)